MYEFWCDYIKPKYQENDVRKRFDASNYEVNRPLLTGKNKKEIGLMKDELGGKIMTEFATLRPKTYSYLMNDGNSDKKAKGTKKCVIKRILKFNDYKDSLLNNQIILNYTKDLKVKLMMYVLKKLIRFH